MEDKKNYTNTVIEKPGVHGYPHISKSGKPVRPRV